MEKRIKRIILALTIFVFLTLITPIGQVLAIDQGQAAILTQAAVLIDGIRVEFDAYEIGGYNYFKLRDLAYRFTELNVESSKMFDIYWRESAPDEFTVIPSRPYFLFWEADTAPEPHTGFEGSVVAVPSRYKINFVPDRSRYETFPIDISAFEINDNNYFKLRDIGELLDFGVSWDEATNTITIETSESYVMP